MTATTEVLIRDSRVGFYWMECRLDVDKQRAIDPKCQKVACVSLTNPHTKQTLTRAFPLTDFKARFAPEKHQKFDFETCAVGQLVECNLMHGFDPLMQNSQWVLSIVCHIQREGEDYMVWLKPVGHTTELRIADSHQHGIGQIRAVCHKYGAPLPQAGIMKHWMELGGPCEYLERLFKDMPQHACTAIAIAQQHPGPQLRCRHKSLTSSLA